MRTTTIKTEFKQWQVLPPLTLECGDSSPLSAGDLSPSSAGARRNVPERLERGSALPTSRQSTESGDKSPHSKVAALGGGGQTPSHD